MKTWFVSLILLICIIVFVANLPSAVSQINKVTIIIYESHSVKQFSEGQQVNLKGQVIYRIPDKAIGLPNAYYKIIHQDTGKVIHDGYTKNDGTFTFNWSAEYFGKRETTLKAIFPASGYYNYAESTLTLEVFSTQPLPKLTYHNTFLSLQVQDGTNQGYIKVKPTLTYGLGGKLSSSNISIYVDGNFKTKVTSNQLSSNIYAGSGSHTIKASIPELTSSTNNLIKYRSSSDTNTFFVKSATSTLTSTPTSSNVGFPVEYVIVGIIVIAVIAGIAVALSKRKKTVPVMVAQPAKVQTASDDTQFWVCPRCGRDIQMKDGKQYCPSCNVYL